MPLRSDAIGALRDWLQVDKGHPTDPLFCNARGRPLSRDGVEYLLAKHAATACLKCASLGHKRVSPSVLRHSLAMTLLQSGVDRSVIALWLGHESIETTQVYFHANLDAFSLRKIAKKFRLGPSLLSKMKNSLFQM
ncbi:MAG: tyrosine-type recombinase/integrase [Limisphaerales bacterium]